MQKRVIEGFQLSPQQKHLWLLQQASYNQHYRVGCAIYIEGKLKKNIWESALQHVVDRYEIFRTIFLLFRRDDDAASSHQRVK